ncbi:MAG: carbon-nitrogen hydrolase family protein [Planctomycetota bacterium]
MSHADTLTIGLAQIAPVWLDRTATLAKVVRSLDEAGRSKCDLVAFGEALVPGYPVWLDRTGGAVFDSPPQKQLHAHYMANAIDIDAGDLDDVRAAAKRNATAVYLGLIERPADRGGHSLYASLVYINKAGEIGSVHRKLMPTYEERLTWSPGDGHGLRVHPLGAFTVGGLNCWENWMPLPRAALYALGEDLHIAVWPGSQRNTQDITRFIARESRSYVVSVSALLRPDDFPDDTPNRAAIVDGMPDLLHDGGSCVAGPNGEFVLEPQVGNESLFVVNIDHAKVREERQNFDPVGHYSRPDVTQLHVNRERQTTARFND